MPVTTESEEETKDSKDVFKKRKIWVSMRI